MAATPRTEEPTTKSPTRFIPRSIATESVAPESSEITGECSPFIANQPQCQVCCDNDRVTEILRAPWAFDALSACCTVRTRPKTTECDLSDLEHRVLYSAFRPEACPKGKRPRHWVFRG